MLRSLRLLGLAALSSAVLVSCDSDSSAPDPTLILAIVAGDQQQAQVGTPVPIPPSVRVTNESGEGVSGVAVTFSVSGGGGSVSGASTTTGSDGVATVGSWTLGTTVGPNTLQAAAAGAQGSPVSFTADATTGPAAQMTKVAGDGQTGEVGQAVAEAPAVRVTDEFGNPVSGVAVSFAVTGGGGSVAGASQTTGSDGMAAVGSWTLGQTPGTNTLEASTTASGVSGTPATFTATATAGAAAEVTKEAGDDQTAGVGQAVSVAPAVKVVDAFGNPVPEAAVTFAVTGGGGSVTGASQTTDADGVATVGSWTLGEAPGENTMDATVEGDGITGNPATFTATATTGAATQMSAAAGDGQTAQVDTEVDVAPTVMVSDAFGNPVAGVSVTFTVTGGGGTVTGSSPSAMADGSTALTTETTTGSDGMASAGVWTLGTAAGANTLEATSPGLEGSPVTFTATATPGPAAELEKAAGDGQTAGVGEAVDVPPTVLVTDAFGNPVAGVDVTFAVTGGGGSVSGASATTGADGMASVGSWTLGQTPGPNSLEATASGSGISGNPATFTATATTAPPASIAIATGDGQTAQAGTAVPIPPAVLVTDAFGNPVAGVGVTFAVTGGGGAVTGASQTTGADGTAAVGAWTLGATPGTNTLDATATGSGISGNPVTFTATGTAPDPAAIAVSAGDGQVQIAGQAVPVAPAVLVTDADDNPVPGVTVTFAVASGGGTVTGATAVTGADGVAAVGSWTLGPNAGENTLTATASGQGIAGNPVTFTATGSLAPAESGGSWSGQWNNDTFSSSGNADLDVVVDEDAKTITLTLDLDGNVFGGSDPAPVTAMGSYSGSGFELNGTLYEAGTGTIEITPEGEVTAVANNPGAGIARVDITGTVTDTQVTLNFTITFTGGGNATGTTTLTKQ